MLSRSLNQRLVQRAASVSESLLAGRNTVLMVESFWKRLLDGSHPWRDNSTSVPPLRSQGVFKSYRGHDSIKSRYPSMQGALTLEQERFPEEQKSKALSYEGRMVAVEGSAFWRPADTIEGRNDKNLKSIFSYGGDQFEMDALAPLDHALRVAYFSSEITNVYLGVHQSSVFKVPILNVILLHDTISLG